MTRQERERAIDRLIDLVHGLGHSADLGVPPRPGDVAEALLLLDALRRDGLPPTNR